MRTMLKLLRFSLLLACAGAALAADPAVKVIALFTDKALLQIDGEQKVVSKGETFAGVTLESASGRGAVVSIGGRRVKLGLNQSIAGNFRPPVRDGLKIYPDSLGMYFVRGEINGRAARFLVDTGATFVTLSGRTARGLDIDFQNLGRRSSAWTASEAAVAVWQIRLDSVEVGGIEVSNVEATVIPGDQPREVLLGNSFLQHTRMQKAGAVLELQQRF